MKFDPATRALEGLQVPEKKPQVPPLRFAPVGMTILFGGNIRRSQNKFVIPTEAKRSGGICGSLPVLTPVLRDSGNSLALISRAFNRLPLVRRQVQFG